MRYTCFLLSQFGIVHLFSSTGLHLTGVTQFLVVIGFLVMYMSGGNGAFEAAERTEIAFG